jgi:capsid protein
MPQYLAASTWQCHRWRPLDPLKHIEAQRSGIEGRLTSPQREIVANGEDPDEILAELLEWAEKTKGLPAAAKPAAKPAPAEPEDDDTEDEAERRRALRLRLIATRSDQ